MSITLDSWVGILGLILVGISAVGSVGMFFVRSETKAVRADTEREVTRLDGRMNTHEKGCEERQHGIVREFLYLKDEVTRLRTALDHLDQRGERIEQMVGQVLQRPAK